MADAKMLKKVPVREQEPKVRATNFEEVCLGYGKISVIEQEVGDLIGEDAISRMIDRDDFVQRLNGFLEKQTRTDRMIFVLRFWYMETPREIAKHMGLKEKNVYNTLYQMRKRFRVYWEQSGKEDTVYEKA